MSETTETSGSVEASESSISNESAAPETGGGKPIAEMTDAERADYFKMRARKAEDALRGKSQDPEKDASFLRKQRDELQSKLNEIEQSKLSDIEKAIRRAETAERELAEVSIRALRAEVAQEKGIPASLLSGATREEMEATANALLAFKGTTPKAPPADGQGNVGKPVANQANQITSRDVLKTMSPAEIAKAKAEGRLNDLLGIKK